MLETPHSLVGGAIGGLTGNPWLAAPAGFASHFAGDVLPHWNPNFPPQRKLDTVLAIIDFIVAESLVVGFWFVYPDRPEIAVGAFFATVPDLIAGARFTFRIRWLRWYERIHEAAQTDVPPIHGLWPQAVLTALSAWYLASL